ncbi:MAG: DUF1080 domain-containing protein [Opitutus sp.]
MPNLKLPATAVGMVLIALVGQAVLAASPVAEPGDGDTRAWENLLAPTLDHWELWMGTPHESVSGLPPGSPVSKDAHNGIALGLGHDPKHVFTLVEQEGEPVLHITGEIFGGLTTKAEYGNYHLRLETKWGTRIWEPKLTKPRDSGLLFHCTGAHGAFWNVWMRSLELQVEQNNIGDLYCLVGTSARVPGFVRDNFWAYRPGSTIKAVGARDDTTYRMGKRSANYERPDDWNLVELYTVGDRAIYLVNGHVVNALLDTGIIDAGTIRPLTRGKLQLQSEGAEIFYRRVQIRPITSIPHDILVAAAWEL